MDNLPKISEAEYSVMEVVWKKYPISTNEVVEILSKNKNWSDKTIQTMLSRLVKKGALSYEKESRTYIYSPIVKKEEYINFESTSFLKKFYNGALNAMVVNFLDNNTLSDKEINELEILLNKRKSNKGEDDD